MDASTIAAIATPAGEGGVGVIRISGYDAAGIAASIFRSGQTGLPVRLHAPRSHRLIYGRIVKPGSEEIIDEAVLGWMAGPHSYTCEDTVELSVTVVPSPSTKHCVRYWPRAPATPNRANSRCGSLLNGRLDLAQAEAVAIRN